MQSLKKLIDDPVLLKSWMDIHAAQSHSELPGIEGRLRTLENDIATNSRRLENLTLRLADLPSEVPAGPIYKQIQAITEKTKELEATREKLSREKTELSRSAVDQSELLFKVKRAIANLEEAPVEDRRPIYSNLIKFAELYPTKIRLGVYAPAMPAAASDAISSDFSLASGMRRAGSCTVSFGAPDRP